MDEYLKINGFLFVNDPHLTSSRMSTRMDKNFGEVVLDKISQCVDIANDRKLLLVFSGDIFHNPVEEDDGLKTKLLRILERSWITSVTNTGNHDIAGVNLSDKDSLSVIGASKHLNVIKKTQMVNIYNVGDYKIGLGMTPYGHQIPYDVNKYFNDKEVDNTIWITHHDLAFDGVYPGATELFEIKGCGIVINGHMHLEKKPVTYGETTWYNFGNITRTAIDAVFHKPAAWEFNVNEGFIKHTLKYDENIFDMSSKLIRDSSPGEEVLNKDDIFKFVDLLQEDIDLTASSTKEGFLLREEIEKRYVSNNISKETQSIINELINELKN
jgi:hypothetical protein